MNTVNLVGRLTADPVINTTTGAKPTTIARYTLAVQRDKDNADYIPCTAFGKLAELAQKYVVKGMKVGVTGSIRTGSYTNKQGQKVYTTEVLVGSQEFMDKPSAQVEKAPMNNVPPTANAPQPQAPAQMQNQDFMNIPADADIGFPFS